MLPGNNAFRGFSATRLDLLPANLPVSERGDSCLRFVFPVSQSTHEKPFCLHRRRARLGVTLAASAQVRKYIAVRPRLAVRSIRRRHVAKTRSFCSASVIQSTRPARRLTLFAFSANISGSSWKRTATTKSFTMRWLRLARRARALYL